jgi:hypothetical protein
LQLLWRYTRIVTYESLRKVWKDELVNLPGAAANGEALISANPKTARAKKDMKSILVDKGRPREEYQGIRSQKGGNRP